MPLSLMPLDRTHAEQLAAGDLSLLSGAPNADAVAAIVQDVARAHAEPWIGYLAWDGRGAVIGTCGFKDACRDGAVEIAYFTFLTSERQGWGGRMAATLVEIAWQSPQVTIIRAHTLPARNASTRILERLGFALTGPIDDPMDGTVWRWELRRGAIAAGRPGDGRR